MLTAVLGTSYTLVADGEKTTVVFMLGGITFAEIAALRFAARRLLSKFHSISCAFV